MNLSEEFEKPDGCVSFLFWNVQGQPRLQALMKLVKRYEVDFVAVAEYGDNPSDLEWELSSLGLGDFSYIDSRIGRTRRPVHAFGALRAGTWTPASDDAHGYVSTYRFETNGGVANTNLTTWIIACAHCPSQMYGDPTRRTAFAGHVVQEIRDVSKTESVQKVVVIGDMNMNPFEEGIAGVLGFNATSTKAQARDSHYTLDDFQYPYLYNPMWSRLGDLSPGPAGSLKFDSGSRGLNLHWNIFDQVMLSPAIMDNLVPESLHIVDDSDTIIELSSNGAPGGLHGTDHYPIRFCMSLVEHHEQ